MKKKPPEFNLNHNISLDETGSCTLNVSVLPLSRLTPSPHSVTSLELTSLPISFTKMFASVPAYFRSPVSVVISYFTASPSVSAQDKQIR